MTAVTSIGIPHPRTRVRLAPVPCTAPPFDDEIGRLPGAQAEPGGGPVGPVPVQGSLALAFALPSGVPAIPAPPPRLRVVGKELARRGPRASSDDEATRPDVARWAAMVVQAAVEVIAGDRPLNQMVRWTTLEVYEQLQWHRRRQVNRSVGGPSAPRRAVVSSVHVCQPDDDVAEACATVRVGGRATAVAVRLEADRDSWRCTAIALG